LAVMHLPVQLCIKHDTIYLGPSIHHCLWVCSTRTITESCDIIFQHTVPATSGPLLVLHIPKSRPSVTLMPATTTDLLELYDHADHSLYDLGPTHPMLMAPEQDPCYPYTGSLLSPEPPASETATPLVTASVPTQDFSTLVVVQC
jgi:hypothetical protein